MRTYGVPQELLTDNGKVFTGRFGKGKVEVLFDRICRENGIDHLLTAPRSPTTTGKIERWHRTLRERFLAGKVFASQADAQKQLDAWVHEYNHDRPHESLDMATPASRFLTARAEQRPVDASALDAGGQVRGRLDRPPCLRGRGHLRGMAADLGRQAPRRADRRHPRRP